MADVKGITTSKDRDMGTQGYAPTFVSVFSDENKKGVEIKDLSKNCQSDTYPHPKESSLGTKSYIRAKIQDAPYDLQMTTFLKNQDQLWAFGKNIGHEDDAHNLFIGIAIDKSHLPVK